MKTQRSWEMPRRCYTCDNPVEGVRVVLTFPSLPDVFLGGKSFQKGAVFVLCPDCGVKLYQLMFKYMKEGVAGEKADWK